MCSSRAIDWINENWICTRDVPKNDDDARTNVNKEYTVTVMMIVMREDDDDDPIIFGTRKKNQVQLVWSLRINWLNVGTYTCQQHCHSATCKKMGIWSAHQKRQEFFIFLKKWKEKKREKQKQTKNGKKKTIEQHSYMQCILWMHTWIKVKHQLMVRW